MSEAVQESSHINIPTDSRSLLGVDIGSVNTRAVLFDTVEGRYRFIAAGRGVSTAGAPLFDASEGFRIAIDQLERISGRAIVDGNSSLLIPSTEDGHGADNLAATLSGGVPLRAIVVGLLDKVSLQSAVNLAQTSYTEVIDTLSLTNRGRDQLDSIIRSQADLIVIAGGTDNGASYSVLKLVNAIGMALYLMPEGQRPVVLFVGNPKLRKQVRAFMDPLTDVFFAPNIRPSLNSEQLGPAQAKLSEIFRKIHASKILGVDELNLWSGGYLIPTAQGGGRAIRFYSKIVPTNTKSVLGIDLGAYATTVSGAFNGDLRQRVFTKFGIGQGLEGLLKKGSLPDISRWIPLDVSQGYIVDYMQNKITNPAIIPATIQDLAVEQALARELIRLAMNETVPVFPKNAHRVSTDVIPTFNPIIVGGAVFTEAPTPGQSMLMILDGLQPAGIVQIILDKNGIAPILGAAAPLNPVLVTQALLDPVAFSNLGYVIAPVGRARHGSLMARIRIVYENGRENTVEVAAGDLATIPLPIGRRARLFIDPLQRSDVGAGPGRKVGNLPVMGGPLGVVVDARGRPLNIPSNASQRRTQLQTWHRALRG